jgi:hypothetical protein
MSERRYTTPDHQPDRLTWPRITQIIGTGGVVGACLTVALLAAMLVAKVLIAAVGQMVFEDGITIIVVFRPDYDPGHKTP